MIDKYKKVIEDMKTESASLLTNLCLLGFDIDEIEELKEVGIAIDNLYENYEKLLKLYKKLKEGSV